MNPSEPLQRSDEPRPLILVAEREPISEDGIRLIDLAVMAYRLRWRVVAAWVAFLLIALLSLPQQAAFEWRMEVDVQPGASQPSQPAGLEAIAMFASERPDIVCEFGKVTVSAKPEPIRTHLYLTVRSDSDTEPPKSLMALRAEAAEWIADQTKRYLDRQADTVAIARERLKAVSQDMSSTGIETRAAASLALAQAESALKFPPIWKISEPVVEPAKPNRSRDWAVKGFGSLAAAIGLVMALEGWSRVRSAARAQLSR